MLVTNITMVPLVLNVIILVKTAVLLMIHATAVAALLDGVEMIVANVFQASCVIIEVL